MSFEQPALCLDENVEFDQPLAGGTGTGGADLLTVDRGDRFALLPARPALPEYRERRAASSGDYLQRHFMQFLLAAV